MWSDISIIIWKEWKELMNSRGSRRSSWAGILKMVIIFGVILPIQWGDIWVNSAAPLSMWVLIPLLLLGAIIADSIAGERERHTIETLLASRLSDQVIILGKIGAAVSYVWLVTQAVFIVALIPVNFMHWQGHLSVYSLKVALSGMLLSFLAACLMSNIGVLISLRAETVKQAQQTLGISVYVFAFIVPLAGIYALRFIPEETRNQLVQPILGGEIGSIVLLASVGLILLNVGLFAVSKTRFQRTLLISNI